MIEPKKQEDEEEVLIISQYICHYGTGFGM